MRGGRIVLALAVLAWLVTLIAWIAADPQLPLNAYEPFSTFNTSAGGLSQAFAYLEARQRAPVNRLEQELSLANPPRNATIFRIGVQREEVSVLEKIASQEPENRPKRPNTRTTKPKKQEEVTLPKDVEPLLSDTEEAWVRAGGRLVIAPSGNYDGVRLAAAPCSGYRQVFPTQPALPKIEVPNCHSLDGEALRRFHSIVINETGPVLARWLLGAGDVILFSIPEAFSNEYAGQGANLSMLEAMAGAKRPVYFDETEHGIEQEATIAGLLVDQWHLGPALAVLAMAALAEFWRRSRSTGPPELQERDVRSDAMDLVQSVGGLYDRAVDREESLRLYFQALARVVHARTGLKGEALDRLVRERTGGYDPKPRYHDISREEFQRMLKILNDAYETVGYANTR